MKKCPKCGASNSDTANYCSLCLIPFERDFSEQERKEEVPKEKEPLTLSVSEAQPSYENTSGQRQLAQVPAEIKRWNWGAFFLHWIWGIGNDTYIALLALIPFFGFVWSFVLGAKGSEWAWRNKRWDSIEHFKHVQRIWAIVGLIVVLGMVFLFIIQIVIAVPLFNAAKQKTLQRACEANIRTIEGALESYKISEGVYPNTTEQLVEKGYFPDMPTCPLSYDPKLKKEKEYIYDSQTGKVTPPKGP